ncbi:MAG: NUDIX hydrolase [Candidatus Poribacteria bacterium]|nr:NUDIX hydrolase [Candidatus Poribacteria bacterium]
MNITTPPSHGTTHTQSSMKFCPKCAGALDHRVIEEKMRQACTACDFILYRDPKPVAGVFAVRDGKLLLIQRGNEPKRGLWSFPTGYIDIGDTPEETAIREAKEEADVAVQLDRLLGVYSNAERTVVLVVYVGSIVAGVPAGRAEALDARLFPPDALPELAFDHDRRILADLFATDARLVQS